MFSNSTKWEYKQKTLYTQSEKATQTIFHAEDTDGALPFAVRFCFCNCLIFYIDWRSEEFAYTHFLELLRFVG